MIPRKSLDEINTLIESKEVTNNDFNLFIEGLPKSTVEKVQRRARLKPGTPLRPKNHSPVKKAEASLQKTGDNDPTRTGRGKISVRKQGEDNKKHADRFREAIEFVLNNHTKSIEECGPVAQDLEDKGALDQLVLKLLSTPDIFIDRGWLHKLRRLNENRFNMVEGRFTDAAKKIALAGTLGLGALGAAGCDGPKCDTSKSAVQHHSDDVQINGNKFTVIGTSRIPKSLGSSKGKQIAQKRAKADAQKKVIKAVSGANHGKLSFKRMSVDNVDIDGDMMVITYSGSISESKSNDILPGGLADKKNKEDFDQRALKQGIDVELEHTDSTQTATEIAMDHLTEDPKYYDKIKKMGL